MRGNIITYPQDPDKLCTILPNDLNNDIFQVEFIGKVRPCPLKGEKYS